MRRFCAALCTLASVLGTIEVANGQASPIPPGGEKCLAFSNLLNDARWRSGKNEQFRIEDPLKTLQYIQYASHNYFELLEPLGGFKSVPQAEELRAALGSIGIDFRPKKWSADPEEALLISTSMASRMWLSNEGRSARPAARLSSGARIS